MDSPVWWERIEDEHDNLRAALRWALETGEAETALRLVAALWQFWLARGYLREGRRWLDEALAQPRWDGQSCPRSVRWPSTAREH